MNINFQIEKVKQNIKRDGTEFTFKQVKLDEFNEPTDEYEEIIIKGLFHQSREYISAQTSNGTTTRTKPVPMILTLITDKSKRLQMYDTVEYCGIKYKINGINNFNNLGIAFDISLEMIDDGS